MAANKVRGVRAALCNCLYTARMARQHNDANVLCLGERLIGPEVASEALRAWLNAEFEGGRHVGRIDKLSDLDGSLG